VYLYRVFTQLKSLKEVFYCFFFQKSLKSLLVSPTTLTGVREFLPRTGGPLYYLVSMSYSTVCDNSIDMEGNWHRCKPDECRGASARVTKVVNKLRESGCSLLKVIRYQALQTTWRLNSFLGRRMVLAALTAIHLSLSTGLLGFEVDWWAFGVCVYEMIMGAPPFHGESVQKIFQRILKGSVLLFSE
jgi:serine/threonine protein kinase